jgi:hypothetical protein
MKEIVAVWGLTVFAESCLKTSVQFGRVIDSSDGINIVAVLKRVACIKHYNEHNST